MRLNHVRGEVGVIVLLLQGCVCSSAAAPPATLVDAHAACRAAAQSQPPQSSPCLRLSSEVQSWASLPSIPEPRRAGLRKLGADIGDFAGEGLAGVDPVDEWDALDRQLRRMLEGKEPGAGPRFRRDLPAEIRAAVIAVDDALRGSQLEQACSGIDAATIALSQWRWSVPAPRALQWVKQATEQLDAMPSDCRSSTIGSVAERWGQAMALLAPEAG